jgi:hypothetical protein
MIVFQIAIGIGTYVLMSFFVWRHARQELLKEETVFDTFFLVSATAIGISRILYISVHFDEFGFGILRWMVFTIYPGFSVIGAIGGLLIGIAYWSRKLHLSYWVVLDSIAMALLRGTTVAVFSMGVFLYAFTADGLKMQTQPIVAQIYSVPGILLVLAAYGVSMLLTERIVRRSYIRRPKGIIGSGIILLLTLGWILVDFMRQNQVYYGLRSSEHIITIVVVGIALSMIISRYIPSAPSKSNKRSIIKKKM